MSPRDGLGGPDLRRTTRWVVGTLVAAALLAASAVHASETIASARAVRVGAAGACLLGALLSTRIATRSEVAGFVAAALSLFAGGEVDAWGAGWAEAAGGRGAAVVGTRLVVSNAANAVAAFLLPAIVGAAWMRIPAGDLLRVPDRLRPFVVAVLAAVLLYPVLRAADAVLTGAIHDAFSAGSAPHAAVWPGWGRVLAHDPTVGVGQPAFARTVLTLAVQLPLLEVFGHGVLRQAFHRWGALPFVLATASFASLSLVSGSVSYAVFGGSLVTGLLAARSASVFPGITFWLALWAVAGAWARFLPP